MAATNTDTLTGKLGAIGDAIREKTESTELLTLDQMPPAIQGIRTAPFEKAFAYSDYKSPDSSPTFTEFATVLTGAGFSQAASGVSRVYDSRLVDYGGSTIAEVKPVPADVAESVVYYRFTSDPQTRRILAAWLNGLAFYPNDILYYYDNTSFTELKQQTLTSYSMYRTLVLEIPNAYWQATEAGVRAKVNGEIVDVDQATS